MRGHHRHGPFVFPAAVRTGSPEAGIHDRKKLLQLYCLCTIMICSGTGFPRCEKGFEGAAMLKKIIFIFVMAFSVLFSVLIFLDILYWVFN
jgi:hypothetical protein